MRPDGHFHFDVVQQQLGLKSIALNTADGILVYAAEGGYSNVPLPANTTIRVYEPFRGYTAFHAIAQGAWGSWVRGFCASSAPGLLLSSKKTG